MRSTSVDSHEQIGQLDQRQARVDQGFQTLKS
jgi:hypothetical protein